MPMTISHVPPCWLGSKQPLFVAHAVQMVVLLDDNLSCCLKQFAVEAIAVDGLHRSGPWQVPAVCPVARVQVMLSGHPPRFGPQETVPPQPSGAVPQLFVPQAAGAFSGVHEHVLLL